jgi:hypothetical protein
MTSTVKLIDNEGGITDIVYTLPPKEAIEMAVNEFVFRNYNTWNPKEAEVTETEVGYTFIFGENSAIWVRK